MSKNIKMANIIQLDITKNQLRAIIEMRDDMKSMIGNGEKRDDTWNKNIRLIDRMLTKNGYKI